MIWPGIRRLSQSRFGLLAALVMVCGMIGFMVAGGQSVLAQNGRSGEPGAGSPVVVAGAYPSSSSDDGSGSDDPSGAEGSEEDSAHGQDIQSYREFEDRRDEYSELERIIAREVIATGRLLENDGRFEDIVRRLAERGADSIPVGEPQFGP